MSRPAGGGAPAIVVFGSINRDIRLAASRIARPGETVGQARLTTHWGGKGANQAVAAARLGGRVLLVSAVGADEAGKEAVGVLDAEGVDCAHVRRVPGSPTGTAVVIVASSGENAITVAPGATSAVTAQELPALLGSASPGVLLTCFELPPATVREAAWIASAAGWDVILNPAPAAGPLPGTWPRGMILTPNAHELAALTGIDDEESAAAALAADTGGTVVATLGERGALVTGPGGTARVPAPRDMTVVDTTGAGDAFNGTLGWCLSRGTELAEAAGIAVRAASASTRREGAREGMLTAAELDALSPVQNVLRSLPGVGQDAGERLEVAGVAVLLAEQPVFGAPEQVGPWTCVRVTEPAHAAVVIPDDLFGQAAVHHPVVGIRGRGNRFPGLRLAFGDHHPSPGRRGGPAEDLRPPVLLPWMAAAIQVQAPSAGPGEGVTGVEVDADGVGEALGYRQRVPLVPGAPPLHHPDRR